ncbi:MAG: hypothetical protein AAF418_01045, partial [Pseudomonadota bacterium]
MFELNLTFDGSVEQLADFVITEQTKVEANAKIIADSGVDEEALKQLRHIHVWELVEDGGEPPVPRLVEALRAGRTGSQDDLTGEETVLECSFDPRENVTQSNYQAIKTNRRGFKIFAFAESGNFKLRLTIFTTDGVPVSQATGQVKVRPATLQGRIEASSAVISDARAYMNYDGRLQRDWTRFDVEQPGAFIAQLCRFREAELIQPTAPDKLPLPKEELDKRFKVFLVRGAHHELVQGQAVDVLYRGKGEFKLAKPLELEDEALVPLKLSFTTTTVLFSTPGISPGYTI